MNTAKQSLQQADQALHAYKRDAAMLTAARCTLSMILTLIGTVIQRALLQHEILQYDAMMQPISHWNWFLPICMVCMHILSAPLHTQIDRWLGETIGVLNECDTGFLNCCHRLWLWYRRALAQLLGYCFLLISFLPSILLLGCSSLCFGLTPNTGDALLTILTAGHLFLLALLALILPLRMSVALSALSFCMLKQPHRPLLRTLLLTFRCTKGIWLTMIQCRLHMMPRLLFPFTMLTAYPELSAAEMLLIDDNCNQHSIRL